MPRSAKPETQKQFVREFYRTRRLSDDIFSQLLSKPIGFKAGFLKKLGGAAALLGGKAFPKQWDDIRPSVLPNVFPNPSSAFGWVAAFARVHSKTLRAIVTDQLNIESGFLIGEYEKSDAKLKRFEEEYGFSLWALDLRFLNAQFSDGYHGNRTSLSKFTKSCNNDWVAFLAFNSSTRAEWHGSVTVPN